MRYRRQSTCFCLSLLFLSLFFITCCLFTANCDEQKKDSTIAISVREAIYQNLLQHPSIKIFLYHIEIQKGIAQSSSAPFDIANIRSLTGTLIQLSSSQLSDQFFVEDVISVPFDVERKSSLSSDCGEGEKE
ncbi:MAG: hypothetical protein ACH350_02765 [Parachlamydiaceae bacterium]